MKNTNEQAEEHVADEAAVYRALVCAATCVDENQVVKTEVQVLPKKSPITVGASKLREKLRQIGQ
jgi:F420-0:gamma-glutamyl ligase